MNIVYRVKTEDTEASIEITGLRNEIKSNTKLKNIARSLVLALDEAEEVTNARRFSEMEIEK